MVMAQLPSAVCRREVHEKWDGKVIHNGLWHRHHTLSRLLWCMLVVVVERRGGGSDPVWV